VNTTRPVTNAAVVQGFELGRVSNEMGVVVARKFSPHVESAKLGERVDGCGVSAVVVARKREIQPGTFGARSGKADGVVDEVDGP
jgi:hypothetical protein